MSPDDFEYIVTTMDPVCGGQEEEAAALQHLLRTTSCPECGLAGYDLVRLKNIFRGRSTLDAWHLYKEWSPRIEAGQLDHDIEPADFARVAILTCSRLMERQPAAIASVAHAALQAIRLASVDFWTHRDIETQAVAWIARSMRISGDHLRAFSLSRRTSSRLDGASSKAKAEIADIYASCLRDLGKPHRATAWCTTARHSFQDAGLYREAAQQLLKLASICWEFWRDGQRAEAAVRQCLVELPTWDRLWSSIAELSMLRYQAEQGSVSSITIIEPFDNLRWEFIRRWTYAKAYRALGRLEVSQKFFHEARGLLCSSDPECIEIELDYCGLLVAEGRTAAEICSAAEQVAQRVEDSPHKAYFTPALQLLRKVVARRLFSEEVFRYVQRRATIDRAIRRGRSRSQAQH
jgi:hypothetical protein